MPVTIDPRYHDAVLFDLDGVPVLDSMVDLLGRLHDAGVATAAYSSRRDWAHALLLYRHRRLPEARRAAKAAGYVGAMFPWQSGSDGREESQQLHVNPRSGRWKPDSSALAQHIGIAVAYNAWKFYALRQHPTPRSHPRGRRR